MPEAATAARTWPELPDLNQLGTRDGCNYELGDAVAATYGNRRASQIYQQYFNFTAIVGVDSAGRIDERAL